MRRGRPAALVSGEARFFVGMKHLTELKTQVLAGLLRRHLGMRLPSASSLNAMCRRHGLHGLPRADRLVQSRPLGHLRIHVLRGNFSDEDGLWEVALAFDPWSRAIVARVAPSFETFEALQAFITTALFAFPPEYRRLFRAATLLHRKTKAPIRLHPEPIYGRHIEPAVLPPLDDRDAPKHKPVYVDGFHLLGNYEERAAFVHFLSRITNDYNGPGTPGYRKTYPDRIPPGWGFTDWDFVRGRVSNVAAATESTRGVSSPAARIAIALSEVPSERDPGKRKYAPSSVAKFLSSDQPRPRNRNTQKTEPVREAKMPL